MPGYETIVVYKPQLSDEQVAEAIEKTKKVITEKGGEITAEDRWGRRKLAFTIAKNREGFYAYVKFNGNNEALERLAHHFKVSDTVLRAQTVKAMRPQRPKKIKTGKPASASSSTPQKPSAPSAQ